MRVAVIHDWLTVYAGAERVLGEILGLYPEADLFTVVDFLPDDERTFLRGRQPATTFVQNLPFARKLYRHYLPLMPLAVEQLNLSAYDVVISSSHAVAKGIITGPDQLHLCLCYSPLRYAWDLQHQYLEISGLDKGPKSWPARWMLHSMRRWDLHSSFRVDEFVAISRFVRRRIRKCYRRDAKVIYPPVETEFFTPGEGEREDFYLTASRLVPYKRVDLLVRAFQEIPDRRLVVIGDGPERKKIERLAGPNVLLLGHQPAEVLRDHLRRTRGFLFAAEEDFGLAPLEAQSCGTPVIALAKGGALETVVGSSKDPLATGLFFLRPSPDSLRETILAFERRTFDPNHCRDNALRFSRNRFREEFRGFVQHRWEKFLAEKEATGPD